LLRKRKLLMVITRGNILSSLMFIRKMMSISLAWLQLLYSHHC